MMDDTKLDKYTVYVKLTVWGESPEDAVDYVEHAIDASDLLTQDGIIGIEIVDDEDTIELMETGYDNDDEDEFPEDY
jgi:hypothetical protein